MITKEIETLNEISNKILATAQEIATTYHSFAITGEINDNAEELEKLRETVLDLFTAYNTATTNLITELRNIKNNTLETILTARAQLATMIELIDIKNDKKFVPGESFIYQNGESVELGVVKSIVRDNKYFCYYHTGDTAALTHARDMKKIRNNYAFEIRRKGVNER